MGVVSEGKQLGATSLRPTQAGGHHLGGDLCPPTTSEAQLHFRVPGAGHMFPASKSTPKVGSLSTELEIRAPIASALWTTEGSLSSEKINPPTWWLKTRKLPKNRVTLVAQKWGGGGGKMEKRGGPGGVAC